MQFHIPFTVQFQRTFQSNCNYVIKVTFYTNVLKIIRYLQGDIKDNYF